MLLGVAQVVLNVADLDPAAQALAAGGYRRSFIERAIPNHPAKGALQARPRERLDMVHFAGPAQTVAVEVTSYDSGPPAGRAAFEVELPPPEGASLRVTVLAGDAQGSLAFWRDALGFRETGDGALALRALRPEWSLAVQLQPAAEGGPTTVDAQGCVLVTFLATELERDLARICDGGLLLRSTPAWEEFIDGRALRVAMLEGPSGELIELIQLPRRGTPSERQDENA